MGNIKFTVDVERGRSVNDSSGVPNSFLFVAGRRGRVASRGSANDGGRRGAREVTLEGTKRENKTRIGQGKRTGG